jgi:hypothetical protein
MKLNTARSSPEGGIKECSSSKDTNLVHSSPLGSGGAVHHTLFTYPHKPKPNPALSPFFEKLEQVKKKLIKN